jgi:hypothetical protein
VIFTAMFFHPKTINPCPLTCKAFITLIITIYSLSAYLPAWVFRLFRLFCLSVLPQKSYFFSHLFYFFFSFLVSFLQFFYFYLVQEIFIDELKIIVTVYFIIEVLLRSKGSFLLLAQLNITHWFAFDVLRNIIFSNYFKKIIVKFCELFVFSSKLLKFFCRLAIANRLKFKFRIMKFRSQIGVFFG